VITTRGCQYLQSRGKEVCPMRTFCWQGGERFFRCGYPHFLV